MKKKYLHILSFDGLSKVDIEFMKTLPAFSEYMKEASGCMSVLSVYPSITYCAHTSITTGVYPYVHGIVNNTKNQMDRESPDWFWHERDIKVDTFQKLANENGYSILSLFWPVSAGSKYIKYNMPEIFANRKWQNQIMVSLMNGSPMFQYNLNKRFGYLRNGVSEPELDNFSHESFLYSLENYKADINMVHYIDLDSQRHEYGFDSKEAREALVRLDKRLGDIVNRLKSIGIYDDSVIVILGDHSSRDLHSNVYVNKLFGDAGLLEYDDKGLIINKRAYCKSADGAGYIYADDEIDDNVLLDIIKPLVQDKIIEAVYTREQAREMGADDSCRFMIEASEGYFFLNPVRDEVVVPTEIAKGFEKKIYKNNHGYNPYTKKDYETVFFVSGKDIKKGVFVDQMNLVDEGPTFASILGFEMDNVQGRVMTEFLEV